MIPVRDTAPTRYPAIMVWVLIGINVVEIVMSEDAVLGPVDPQVGPYPAASVVKAVEAKPIADPTEILELMDLYPQPVRRHPSVTYLPSRRHAAKEVDNS